MIHPDGDTLLKHVLQFLEEPDEGVVRDHLRECAECRTELETLMSQVHQLTSAVLPLDEAVVPPPLPRKQSPVRIIFRAAAVLAIGFLLGYLSARLMEPDERIVVGQYFRPVAPEASVTQYAPCEQEDRGVYRAL